MTSALTADAAEVQAIRLPSLGPPTDVESPLGRGEVDRWRARSPIGGDRSLLPGAEHAQIIQGVRRVVLMHDYPQG